LYGAGEQLRLFGADDGGAIAQLRIPEQRRDSRQPVAVPAAIAIDDELGDDIGLFAVPQARLGRRGRDIQRIAVAWMVCGALWFQQSMAYLEIRGRLTAAAAESTFAYDMASALWWIPLTILLFAIIERRPIAGAQRWFRGALYLVGCIPLVAVHVTLTWFVGPGAQPLISPAEGDTFIGDFLLYWVIVAIGHRRYLVQWLRERELATRQLRSALAKAQSRAALLQANPDVVLTTLERLAAIVSTDAAQAERVLARLGDYLRLALDDHLERGLAGDRARELASVLGALERETGAIPVTGFGGLA
jgi:hypothetical protein